MCLTDYVARMHDAAFVVDACGARDKHVATVAVVNHGASLEAHTVVAGAVEMSGCIEPRHLFGQDAADGIGIHKYEYVALSSPSADASAGDEVGVGGESLGEESPVAGIDHTGIVQVNIVDEEPCAYAVVA